MGLEFILDLLSNLSRLVQELYGFLFETFTVAFKDYTVWGLLGGIGIVVLIVWSILT